MFLNWMKRILCQWYYNEIYFNQINPSTGEWNPPRGVFNGAEPTRYGDWEIKGRCYDF